MTLIQYQCKKNKTVLILSSLHPDVIITDTNKKKPETVIFYNETKAGVDSIDQMAKAYTTKTPCFRWPVYVFYNVLDLAAINAFLVYKEVISSNISRRDFMYKLIEELCDNFSKKDISYKNLKRKASNCNNSTKKRSHCNVTKCKNKTSTKCQNCKKFICGTCTAKKVDLSYCSACI